jgi:hypothetical protein
MNDIVDDKSLNEHCDMLLWQMYNDARFTGTKKTEGFDIDYISANRMENDGYISVNWQKDAEIRWRAKITQRGIEFVASGGYSRFQEHVDLQNEIKRENLKLIKAQQKEIDRNTLYSIGSFGIAALSFVVAAIALIRSC